VLETLKILKKQLVPLVTPFLLTAEKVFANNIFKDIGEGARAAASSSKFSFPSSSRFQQGGPEIDKT
jgi:hypothetical protein